MVEPIEQREIAGLLIKIDRDACSAYKACIAEAPGVFVLDAQNVVTFTASPGTATREQLLDACRACPVEALAAYDLADGRRLVP